MFNHPNSSDSSHIKWDDHQPCIINPRSYQFNTAYCLSEVRHLIGFLMIQISFCIRLFSFRKNYHRKLCNDDNNIDTLSIPIDEFESYVSIMHRDNNLGFSRLFETICQSSIFPTDISQIECNKSKNRYMDVLPCMYCKHSLISEDHFFRIFR
jgi:hypothetical protein